MGISMNSLVSGRKAVRARIEQKIRDYDLSLSKINDESSPAHRAACKLQINDPVAGKQTPQSAVQIGYGWAAKISRSEAGPPGFGLTTSAEFPDQSSRVATATLNKY